MIQCQAYSGVDAKVSRAPSKPIWTIVASRTATPMGAVAASTLRQRPIAEASRVNSMSQ